MIVIPVKTHKITTSDKLFDVLDKYLPEIPEKSVAVITSKIVSITEGRMVRVEDADKDELIKSEAQYYLPREENKYGIMVTITNNTLVASAGVDESNANGNYILWPSDPQESANKIREHLQKRFNIKNIGVIITDSKTTPMRWGVTAISIAYSGIEPLKDYVGKKDLFGRKFVFEKMSIIDNLASAAVVVMGEGDEQTPIAVISDVPFVKFVDKNPTEKELASLKISMEEDLYGTMLKSTAWRKGRS